MREHLREVVDNYSGRYPNGERKQEETENPAYDESDDPSKDETKDSEYRLTKRRGSRCKCDSDSEKRDHPYDIAPCKDEGKRNN